MHLCSKPYGSGLGDIFIGFCLTTNEAIVWIVIMVPYWSYYQFVVLNKHWTHIISDKALPEGFTALTCTNKRSRSKRFIVTVVAIQSRNIGECCKNSRQNHFIFVVCAIQSRRIEHLMLRSKHKLLSISNCKQNNPPCQFLIQVLLFKSRFQGNKPKQHVHVVVVCYVGIYISDLLSYFYFFTYRLIF